MSDSELAVVVAPQTFPTPILIERAGPSTRKKFFEFFTVPIRNAHTRAAYYRAIQQFLAWVERAGYQDLEDIEPITVAAYIEILQRQAAPPTVKQHMAAIRMLFSWLTEKGVLAMNPAREVKTERFSRTEGKTPAFVEGEVQKLLGTVETSTPTGLRGSRSARGPCLHFRPDRRRREPQSRRLLSVRETFFAPVQGERRQRKGAPRSPQVGRTPGPVP
jgi:Phage integrase, N-terminal SAM-like domain